MTEQPNSPKPNSSKVEKSAYALACLSFIPLVGILLGLISLVYGLSRLKRGGLGVALLGAAGILFSVVIYGFLFTQLFNPIGPFALAETKLLQTHTLPDLVRRLEFYKIINGHYPDRLEDTDSETIGLMRMNDLNRMGKIVYQPGIDRQTYYLFAVGQDGLPFTADDIYPEMTQAQMAKIGFRKKQLAQ